MPTTPPVVLKWMAKGLTTRAGRVLSRRTFFALMERALPLPTVDAMADARPVGDPGAPRSPFVEALTSTGDPPRSGPLGGERVAVKDSIDVAGTATRLGLSDELLPRDHFEVPRDAVIVERLRRAGAIIAGKALMTELGMDGIGALVVGAMPPNAIVPGYIPGGSSTGTAIAVASGAARFGVGGDGLGSVRIPAAFQGLVGLKPGQRALPLEGYRSVAPAMDVPGPMARDVADCALVLDVMAGRPPSPIRPVVPRRVGILRGLGPELASRDVRAAFERALEALGAERMAIDVEGAPEHLALAVATSTEQLAASVYATRTRSGQGLINVAMGSSLAGQRHEIDARRHALRDGIERALDRCAVIAMPTTAVPPPAMHPGLVSQGQDILLLRAIGAYTPIANITELPAITVPVGVDGRGRPLGLMLLGPEGSERALLEHAAAIEALALGKRPIG